MDNDPYLQGFDESILTLTPESNFKLTQQGASIFAGLALKCIQQEFPNKLGHVMDKADDIGKILRCFIQLFMVVMIGIRLYMVIGCSYDY